MAIDRYKHNFQISAPLSGPRGRGGSFEVRAIPTILITPGNRNNNNHSNDMMIIIVSARPEESDSM